MHGGEDVTITLRNVAFVPGLPFGLCSFNVIHENIYVLDDGEAHNFDGRVLFRQKKFRNIVEGTRGARHDKPP